LVTTIAQLRNWRVVGVVVCTPPPMVVVAIFGPMIWSKEGSFSNYIEKSYCEV
jgi:hypothetical protein